MKSVAAVTFVVLAFLLTACGGENKIIKELRAQGLNALATQRDDAAGVQMALIQARGCKMWFTVDGSGPSDHAIWERGSQFPVVQVTPQLANRLAGVACSPK